MRVSKYKKHWANQEQAAQGIKLDVNLTDESKEFISSTIWTAAGIFGGLLLISKRLNR